MLLLASEPCTRRPLCPEGRHPSLTTPPPHTHTVPFTHSMGCDGVSVPCPCLASCLVILQLLVFRPQWSPWTQGLTRGGVLVPSMSGIQ